MAMIRSSRTLLNSVGEERSRNNSNKNSLNLSISSIRELGFEMSVSSEDVGDDDVFGQEAKDKMPAGNSVAEKNISDAAIRAMFAKKAAKTIHGSLKQKLKSSVEIQIRKLLLSWKYVFTDRVIYARKAGEGEFGATVEDGEKISMEMACVSNLQVQGDLK